MHRLRRVTPSDYRDFRRSYSKIEYSFFKKGQEQPELSQKIREMTKFAIKSRIEFLNWVEDPKNELFFFEVDGEIQGIVELVFSQNVCDIHQFAIFEKGMGWGTILYEEVLNIIKEHKCRKITLWCPYEGAQVFWRKQGFKTLPKFFFEKKVKL